MMKHIIINLHSLLATFYWLKWLMKIGSHKFFAELLICDVDICDPFFIVVSVRKDSLPCVCGLWLFNCSMLLRSKFLPAATVLILGPGVCYRRSPSWFCLITSSLLLNMYGTRGVNLTTHVHLMPRLRTSGALPVLPIQTFKTWTGKTLRFYLVTPWKWDICPNCITSAFQQILFN